MGIFNEHSSNQHPFARGIQVLQVLDLISLQMVIMIWWEKN